MATRLYVVVAIASNGVIGKDGKLPWHLPEDLAHFRKITIGHPIIMGRRTWESFRKPLPDREHIVVSRRAGYEAPGASVASSLQAAIALCAGEPVAFVIGGTELFREALPIADGVVVTDIDKAYDGDTWFPEWDRSAWKVTQRESHTSKDGVPFSFALYEKASA